MVQSEKSLPQYAGKLLLQAEIPPGHRQDYFTPIPSVEKHRWGRRCRRCGNQANYKFAQLPHTACGKRCWYCRSCIQMGRVLECEPLYYGHPFSTWTRYEAPCAWQGELTPAQQVAASAISELVEKGSGELLVWAVCGAGKTEMLFPGLTLALQQGKRVCLATPRTDVVRELLPRFRQAFPDVPIEALYGDSPDKSGSAQLMISTTHQLLRYAHAFDVMIIDEVDAFPYHQDSSLHYAANRAAKPQAAVLYLTATPRKQQRRRIQMKKLPVVFIPKRFHGHPLPVPQFKLLPTLHKKMENHQLPASILTLIDQQQQSPRQLLIFVPVIAQAEAVAKLLSTHDPAVPFVHAEDPDRADKITAFREKRYRMLVTTTILERGVTFPSVDVFVLDAGHEVFDEAALVQISGRAGRSPDDPRGDVLFFHSGKTNAMVDAVNSISKMNRLGKKS